jgi:hypothetical protein
VPWSRPQRSSRQIGAINTRVSCSSPTCQNIETSTLSSARVSVNTLCCWEKPATKNTNRRSVCGDAKPNIRPELRHQNVRSPGPSVFGWNAWLHGNAGAYAVECPQSLR